jgi:hypothetical protein
MRVPTSDEMLVLAETPVDLVTLGPLVGRVGIAGATVFASGTGRLLDADHRQIEFCEQ